MHINIKTLHFQKLYINKIDYFHLIILSLYLKFLLVYDEKLKARLGAWQLSKYSKLVKGSGVVPFMTMPLKGRFVVFLQ